MPSGRAPVDLPSLCSASVKYRYHVLDVRESGLPVASVVEPAAAWSSDVSPLDPGNGLLAACIVFSSAAAVLSLPMVGRRVWKGEMLPPIMATSSFASVTCALVFLSWASMTSDFTYIYVWEHSSTELDPIYRLSAVWAGGEGSLLLCTWLVSLVLVIEIVRRRSGKEVGPGFRKVFAAVMSLLVAFFSFSVLASGLFDRLGEGWVVVYPEGNGMDVALQTPEMVLHAPLIFGAYASLAAVFAASVAYHVSGDRSWHRVGLPWGRLGWLMLTAGIGLGAVWAYYVIGWGGYWSWDPVETASLIPWLMVTAFLHTQLRHARKGEYAVASPMFGMMSFVGVVFVSFVVRAGGLWGASVHDYGASVDSSAVSRLVTLVREEPSIAGTLLFLLVLLVLASLLSVLAFRRAGPRPSAPAPKRLSGYITDQNSMFLAVTLLAFSALAAVALMVKNIQSDQSTTFAELDQKMSLIFAALMMSLGLCLGWRLVGRERMVLLSLGIVGASAALAVVAAVTGSFDGMVAFALPSFLFVISVSIVRLAQSLMKGSAKGRLFKAGAQVVHVGVALVFMAYVVSTNMQSYPAGGSEIAVEVGSRIQVDDYTLHMVDIYSSNYAIGYPVGVNEVRGAVFDIYKDGVLVEAGVQLEVLYGDDPVKGTPVVLEKVAFVRSSLTEDLYMSIEWMFGGVVLLHAKVVPMMYPLWTGAVLLLAGLAMRLWAYEAPAASGRPDV